MTKFHFNPENGEPGQCKAEIECPFGLPLNSHFESLREAAVGAESYLKEQAGGSFGMVEDYDQWSARRASERNPITELPTAPKLSGVEHYSALMPNQLKRLGHYARSLGMDLQETWHFAGKLYDKPADLNDAEVKKFVNLGMSLNQNEAFDKCDEIDKVLNDSKFFASPKFKNRKSGLVLEIYSNQGAFDYITRVDESGKASFEVYDHEEGESQYSENVDGWQSSISDWMPQFKQYQDHLYSRVLWQKELERRMNRSRQISLAQMSFDSIPTNK